jgi:cytochrome b subunit of formate dehydrogenase
MAATPIHGVSGEGLRTPAAEVVEKIYIVAIVVIIGLMVIHWLIDLGRQIRVLLARRPQVRRMRTDEVWQHMLLTVSFIALVISGFALRFEESWPARFFFGWEGGFELRGVIHRIAAVVFMGTVVWHGIFLASNRGRRFLRDMMPLPADFKFFLEKILYNLGRRQEEPQFGRFSYVEKAEYWALVWGTAVMIGTGIMLWFDNWIIQFLPKGILDVALVIHYWEAWLATLAILVWHMYSVVFNPHVYPMNPSWLTGYMPEEMYRQEHPGYVEEAKRRTKEIIEAEMEKMRPRDGEDRGEDGPDGGDEPDDGTSDDGPEDDEEPEED